MIDTDKYKGHTPAPWGRDYDSVFEYGGEEIARLTLGNEANEQLIADAPLLLEEVKRLRRLNNYLWEHRSSHWSADDDAEMDRLEMME